MHYEVIDQTTGLITAEGETPYHGLYSMSAPIRVSDDGSKVLIGSGNIFNSSDMTWSTSLGLNIDDALWIGELIVTVENEVQGPTLKLWNKDSFALIRSFDYTDDFIKVIANNDDLILIQSTATELVFSEFLISDQDGDGIPHWWENLYGLSDSDIADADLDGDIDGLSNLQEFIHLTNPTDSDSDDDNLSDGEEVTLYLTDPILFDSDADGLNDGEEVLEYLTDPNNTDSDSDTFSDYYEVMIAFTDPNDLASIPDSVTSMSESFEAISLPGLWQPTSNSITDWQLSSDFSFDGSQSLKSGSILHNQQSAVEISLLFAAGILTYNAKIDAESCCDKLVFYVDGTQQNTISSSGWTEYSVELTSGVHALEWRYTKDSSVNTGSDAAWIDLVSFESP